MFYKKLFTALIITLISTTQPIFAFTIINQTDLKKVLIIEEALERKEVIRKGAHVQTTTEVESLGHPPHKITILPKTIVHFDLKEPCTDLIVGVKTVTVKKGKGKKTKNTITSSTAYGVYDYQEDQPETHITNAWGLVIHNPLPMPNVDNLDYFDFFERMNVKRAWENTKEQGYGIKCLHPKLLEKVTSLDELPAELK